jgi:hypothetical protein
MINILSKSKQPNRVVNQKITSWISDILREKLTNDVQIMVTEVECYQVDCVPLETLIIILGKESQRVVIKVLKPICEVEIEDIKSLEFSIFIKEPEQNEGETKTNHKISDNVEAYNTSLELMFQNIMLINDQNIRNDISNKLEEMARNLRGTSYYVPRAEVVVSSTSNHEKVIDTKPLSSFIPPKKKVNDLLPSRHIKGVRQRGCPCK